MALKIKRLLILLLLMGWGGQLAYASSELVITGTVKNQEGDPLSGETVYIHVSGETGNSISTNPKTDALGNFRDTIVTGGGGGVVLIYVYDCNFNVDQKFSTFSGDEILSYDFVICGHSTEPCESNFYFVQDSLNHKKLRFYNNSTSSVNINTYDWDFGDSTTSSQETPQHVYQDTGRYNVCLEIGNVDSCSSVFCDTVNVHEYTSQCNANFYAQKDTSTALMNYYHFFDNSTPADDIINYFWDFDDGNYAYTQNPDHQFMDKGTYSVTLLITTVDSCTSQHTQRITIEENTESICIADFRYEEDTSSSSVKEYRFYDQTMFVSAPVIAHYWEFGDGSQSTKNNPSHTFPDIGTYKVSLTIVTADSCISTREKMVTVGSPSYYLLGGQVFYNAFPIDEFDVILYRDINNYLEPVDTVRFDTLGYFYFINVIQGDYKVKIYPTDNSSYVDNTAPTYYDHELFWNVSKSIHLDQDIFNMDVDLVALMQGNGNGKINGRMYYDTAQASQNYPPGKHPDLEMKEVYVLDKNTGDLVNYTYTNTSGVFSISDLPYGDYQVYADYAGKYCSPVDVTLDQNNPVVDSVFLKIQMDKISGIVSQKTRSHVIGEIYPNPSCGLASIPLKLNSACKIEVSVRTITGQGVRKHTYKLPAGEQKLEMNLEDLQKGMYLIEILSSDNQIAKKEKLIIL
ncbi:MAG: PKD domain-containing protein [Bacteroidales bacterium]